MWLIQGEKQSGKTKALWKILTKNKQTTMMLCIRDKIEEDPPEDVIEYWKRTNEAQKMGTSTLEDDMDSIFGNIQMRYVTNEADLKRVLACIHVVPARKRPSVIAIDDLDVIVSTYSKSR